MMDMMDRVGIFSDGIGDQRYKIASLIRVFVRFDRKNEMCT